MTTIKHFEDLWEKGESLHKNDTDSTLSILDKLILHIELYKMIEGLESKGEEQEKAKSRLMGEILLTLTNLSLKDNINVFEALNKACQNKTSENFNKIPSDFKIPGFIA